MASASYRKTPSSGDIGKRVGSGISAITSRQVAQAAANKNRSRGDASKKTGRNSVSRAYQAPTRGRRGSSAAAIESRRRPVWDDSPSNNPLPNPWPGPWYDPGMAGSNWPPTKNGERGGITGAGSWPRTDVDGNPLPPPDLTRYPDNNGYPPYIETGLGSRIPGLGGAWGAGPDVYNLPSQMYPQAYQWQTGR